MNILEILNFSITQCEMSEIIEESHRFLLHISLVHVITYIIDGKAVLFGSEIIKTLVVTAIAIIIYNIIFRKAIKSKLKKVNSACYVNVYNDMDVEAVYGAQ